MFVGSTLLFASCTDLKVNETDSIVTTNSQGGFLGVPMPATLDGAYNSLNWENSQQDLYALTEATTDEIFIPTRGTDWGDNGVWRDLAKHSWTSAHTYNFNTWTYLNTNVYVANQIIHPKTKAKPLQVAEAKFIRAYNMFWVLDLWRQVPYRTADQGPEINPTILTPQQAIDTIEADLLTALPALPATASEDIDGQKKASKASVHFMLAKLYLNKNVYLGGAVDAADMTKVIEQVDAITDDGYQLQNGYFSIFGPSADSETIFWANGQYAQRIWGGLHYNQGKETDWKNGGWNGFATTAEFYDKFEGDKDANIGDADNNTSNQEERRGYVPDNALGIGFLIGKQYSTHTDDNPSGVLKARSGADLNFTRDVPSLLGNPDFTGIRLLKWHPTINMGGTWNSHLLLMRYADAYLMKAEALFRKNATDVNALSMVNDLRDLRGASVLPTLTADNLIDERGRELYLEGWRRNDLVRFGKFNTKFAFVENTEAGRELFPIPDNALGSNPNLKQNPGY